MFVRQEVGWNWEETSAKVMRAVWDIVYSDDAGTALPFTTKIAEDYGEIHGFVHGVWGVGVSTKTRK